MALRDVERDAADIIDAAELEGLTLGETLFSGPMPQVDGLLVTCRETGGDVELAQEVDVFTTEVTVLISTPREAYRPGKLMANAIWSTLFLARAEPYLEILPDGAGPSYLGPDGQGRHVFSIRTSFKWAATDAEGDLVVLDDNGTLNVNGLHVGNGGIVFADDSIQLVAAPSMAEIAAVFLSQMNAAATYETIAHAASTYETKTHAAATYATLAALAGYLPLTGGTLSGNLSVASGVGLNGGSHLNQGLRAAGADTILTSPAAYNIRMQSNQGFDWAVFGAGGSILTARLATDVGLKVKGAASQSANLLQTQNSSDQVLLEAKPTGEIVLTARSATPNIGKLIEFVNADEAAPNRWAAYVGGQGNYEGYFKFGRASLIEASNNWAFAIYEIAGAYYVWSKATISAPVFAVNVQGLGDQPALKWVGDGTNFHGHLKAGIDHPYGAHDFDVLISADAGYFSTRDAEFTVRNQSTDDKLFRLSSRTGNVGIGTNQAPAAAGGSKVTVDGSVEVTAGNSYVLKSPNGTRYKLQVANDGTLSTAAA